MVISKKIYIVYRDLYVYHIKITYQVGLPWWSPTLFSILHILIFVRFVCLNLFETNYGKYNTLFFAQLLSTSQMYIFFVSSIMRHLLPEIYLLEYHKAVFWVRRGHILLIYLKIQKPWFHFGDDTGVLVQHGNQFLDSKNYINKNTWIKWKQLLNPWEWKYTILNRHILLSSYDKPSKRLKKQNFIKFLCEIN